MPRPTLQKHIEQPAVFTCFKPAGIPRHLLEKVEITAEEFEAFRLCHLEGLTHIDGAQKMNTSAPTFHRLCKSAGMKIADAMVNGKGIRVYHQDGSHNCE